MRYLYQAKYETNLIFEGRVNTYLVATRNEGAISQLDPEESHLRFNHEPALMLTIVQQIDKKLFK